MYRLIITKFPRLSEKARYRIRSKKHGFYKIVEARDADPRETAYTLNRRCHELQLDCLYKDFGGDYKKHGHKHARQLLKSRISAIKRMR